MNESVTADKTTTSITTTETLSVQSTHAPLETSTTSVPSTFTLDEQESDVLLPVQIEVQDTQQLAERAQRMFGKLQAHYAAPVEKPIEQPSGIKAKRERNARIAKAKKLTPFGDEYTLREKDIFEKCSQEKELSAPRADMQVYMDRAVHLGMDTRQLFVFAKTVTLDENGEADPEELERVKEFNRTFAEDFSSGDRKLQKPHLDRIVGEIMEFKFSPNMFEPERMMQNLPEMIKMSQYLTSLSDLLGKFPWYFEALPDFQKEMIDNFADMGGAFGMCFEGNIRMHGYDASLNKFMNERDMNAARNILEIGNTAYPPALEQFERRKQAAMHQEADRLAQLPIAEDMTPTYVQPVGQGAYKYGMPSSAQTREIIKLQSQVSDEDFEEISDGGTFDELYRSADDFYAMLNAVTAGAGSAAQFTALLANHQSYIERATALSQRLGSSRYQSHKAVAGALGFMAMKAMSYSAVIANLESEFKYSVSMGDQRALKTKIDDSGMGAKYEGRHKREQYDGVAPDKQAQKLPVLSSRLRALVGDDIAKDKDLAAIAMTIDAYEDFLDTAQVPPCQTDEEKAAYPARIEQLCGELLAFNDRITCRALGYLQTNATAREKTSVCRALEGTVLERDSKENNFERVAELAYRLQHNDFSNAGFNQNYTGKTVTEALRNTKIATMDVKSGKYKKAGDAASVVYITKDPSLEQAVYRRGAEYRPWKEVEVNGRHFGVDLDEVKGGIRGYHTTEGRIIDAHKSSRDVAVSRVDKLLGANVIAEASHVRFSVDGKEETIGTKMQKGVGTEAKNFSDVGFEYGALYGAPNTQLDLSKPQSIMQIYWLQVVDAICGSADRHMGNFFLQTDERGAIQQITGIDNDMAFGEDFLPIRTMMDQQNLSAKNHNPFFMFTPIYENAFPCIPKEIYDKVMALTPENLAKELRGSVRDSELEVTIARLNVLKEHLSTVPKYDMSDSAQSDQCIDETHENAYRLQEEFERTRNPMCVTGNYFAMLSSM